MSVSRKVLRKMRKAMGVIGTFAFSAICTSQVSFADFLTYHDTENGNDVYYKFCLATGELSVDGKGNVSSIWKTKISYLNKETGNSNAVHLKPGEVGFSAHVSRKYRNEVKSVVIGDGIKEICKSAFSNCFALKGATISKSVEVIGDFAFSSSGFTEFTVPGNVKKIGDYAFSNCSNLENITLEYGVEELGKNVFSGSRCLKKCCFPTSLRKIGKGSLLNKFGKSCYIPCNSDLTIMIDKYIISDISLLASEYKKFKPAAYAKWFNLGDENVKTLPIKYAFFKKTGDNTMSSYKVQFRHLEKESCNADKKVLEISEKDFSDEESVSMIVDWLVAVR